MSVAAVSVILPIHNEGAHLGTTIASLRKANDRPAEIIVVDDGSTDGAAVTLTQAEDLVVVTQKRAGVAGARNAGAQVATQPVLIFMDAHCCVAANWLSPLMDMLNTASDAIVGPSVRDSRDPSVRGCGAVIVDDALRYRWRTTYSDKPIEVRLLPGGCMAMRRGMFIDIGGFDELKYYGLEDVELCLRAWRFGVPVFGVPESGIDHFFRPKLPYHIGVGSAAYNLCRTALIHFEGERRRRCLTRASTLPHAASGIVEAINSNWEERLALVNKRAVRSIEGFFSCA